MSDSMATKVKLGDSRVENVALPGTARQGEFGGRGNVGCGID